MPDQYQMSVDNIVTRMRESSSLSAFGRYCFSAFLPKRTKSAPEHTQRRHHSEGDPRDQDARFPDLLVITDVCLCEYTSHGHCGVIEDGYVQNDTTLELLVREAVSHARSGRRHHRAVRHDGRTRRRDSRPRSTPTDSESPIMAYSAKYASAFYGPFREAAGSAPAIRRSHAATRWIRQTRVKRCAKWSSTSHEGADIVMVKPALAYLDVIRACRTHSRAGGRLQRLGRVLDGQGGGRQRLARRTKERCSRS